jgi:tRNA dimethylallyltransferase
MDIGTAKPTPEERSMVKHHMIDIIEPWETYSTGQYIDDVRPIIDRMLDNGKLPLIAGGTGLYLKAMTRGLFEGPSADRDLRDELIAEEETDPGSLHRRLSTVDQEAAARILPGDIRRIVRALEVCLATGARISEIQSSSTIKLPYEFMKIGLMRDRDELYRIINDRVDNMFRLGLVNEVRNVIEMIRSEVRNCGNADAKLSELTSLQAIGYKELISHFNGERSMQEAIELIKQRSRNYAKRQFTWFRREEGINWIDITSIQDPLAIEGRVLQKLEKLAR